VEGKGEKDMSKKIIATILKSSVYTGAWSKTAPARKRNRGAQRRRIRKWKAI